MLDPKPARGDEMSMVFRYRSLLKLASDSAIWVVALFAAAWARYEFTWSALDTGDLLFASGVAVGIQGILGIVSGLYIGRWRTGSFEEAGVLGASAVAIGGAMFVMISASSGAGLLPRSVPIAAAAFFFLAALASRSIVRQIRSLRSISRHRRAHRALIFGAGEGGEEVIQALLADRESDILPVAVLDDDPDKRARWVHGRRVVGGRANIAEAAGEWDADTLIIATPSAERSEIAAIAAAARAASLRVLILPRVALALSTGVTTSSIRELEFKDFLGRSEVDLDLDQISHFITGKRVMVTGAGGSIGSVLSRVINQYEPSKLFCLDRDESALHALQLDLEGRALLDTESLIIGDIRDAEAMHRIMERYRPDVVFHTAALKHVTFLERFPSEGVKTNVFGTLNLLRAARDAGVPTFVNISTDKAADPKNVLGATKRIAEMLTAEYGADPAFRAISVRFGNVLGSRGSVIPTFRRQIENGGPITVTHPEVTRYFMTVEEAVQLVVQAGAVGASGEVMVLDMGEPVKIVELAHELIAEIAPGADIGIEFTGLRPGEKMHEILVGDHEELIRRPHPMLNAYQVPPMTEIAVEKLHDVMYEVSLHPVMWALVS